MLSIWERKFEIEYWLKWWRKHFSWNPQKAYKAVDWQFFFQPTDMEENSVFDVFWERSETAQIVCKPNWCFFTVMLFNEGLTKKLSKTVFSVRIGDLQKLHWMTNEVISAEQSQKPQDIAKCIKMVKLLKLYVMSSFLFFCQDEVFENSCLIWPCWNCSVRERNLYLKYNKEKLLFGYL